MFIQQFSTKNVTQQKAGNLWQLIAGSLQR